METLAIYLAAGSAAGLAAGMFGVGGGLIIVPVLLFVFAQQGISEDVAMHLAVGSSLATIIVTSVSSLRAHYRLGNILWPVFRPLAVGVIAGAVAGARIAGLLPAEAMQAVFAAFALGMAARMAFGGQPPPHRTLPGKAGLASFGALVGTISAIVGIGGGGLTVPFLSWCGTEMRRAVGTSAAIGLPIALAGSVGFIAAGSAHDELPPGATGFIYWPAVVTINLASALLAPVGARIASRLPQHVLRRGFALFLVGVGLRLLVR